MLFLFLLCLIAWGFSMLSFLLDSMAQGVEHFCVKLLGCIFVFLCTNSCFLCVAIAVFASLIEQILEPTSGGWKERSMMFIALCCSDAMRQCFLLLEAMMRERCWEFRGIDSVDGSCREGRSLACSFSTAHGLNEWWTKSHDLVYL